MSVLPILGTRVKINGEDALLYRNDKSITFDRGGSIEGIVKDSIQMVKPSGNGILVVYVAGSEIKSAKIEPL